MNKCQDCDSEALSWSVLCNSCLQDGAVDVVCHCGLFFQYVDEKNWPQCGNHHPFGAVVVNPNQEK